MKKILLILLFLIASCSNANDCPDLVFNTIDGTTNLNNLPYTGRCTTYKDGFKRSIQQYVNGVDYGKWIFYHSNGKIETKGKFKEGLKVGVWKYFYSNGKIKQISRYSSQGERKGLWTEYDSLGELIEKIKY